MTLNESCCLPSPTRAPFDRSSEVPQPSVFWIISEICDSFCFGDSFLGEAAGS